MQVDVPSCNCKTLPYGGHALLCSMWRAAAAANKQTDCDFGND